MKLITSKTPAKDITAFFSKVGMTVDLTEVDGGIRALALHHNDAVLAIQVASPYSPNIGVLVKEPPTYVKKWFVRGTAFDLPIERSFEYEHEASALKRKFENRADNSGESDQVQLTVTEEDVEVVHD